MVTIPLTLISLGITVLWIMILVHQAKKERWVWFVLTLLLPFFGIFYGINWLVDEEFR